MIGGRKWPRWNWVWNGVAGIMGELLRTLAVYMGLMILLKFLPSELIQQAVDNIFL